MDDLLQKQIRDSCKLALPDGLQDLMSDISREVLRAQPQNLLQFITDYLASLLVTRENLFIGSHVCDDVCKTQCYPELEDELQAIGLSDEDAEKTVKVVTDFFESGRVIETNLLIKLLKKTEIDETQLPAVLEAVRGAFRRHQVNNTVVYESSSTDSDMDDTQKAVKHTLEMYRKTKDPCENYKCVVEKIQAAYRGYNVRRKVERQNRETALTTSPNKKKTEGPDAAKKALQFDSKKVELLFSEKGMPRSKRCASKASSISLAGSFIPLPPYKPYSIDDIFSDVDEVSEKEKEHVSFDYTQQWKTAPEWNNSEPGQHASSSSNPGSRFLYTDDKTCKETYEDKQGGSRSLYSIIQQEPGDKQKNVSMKKKNISFHDLPQIIYKNSEDGSDEVPEEVETENEDADDELKEIDEELLQEQFIKDHDMGTHHYTKPTEENKEDEKTVKQKPHEWVVEELTIETLKENTEVPSREDDDLVDEELVYEPATVIEDDAVQSNNSTTMTAKNYETEGDEIIIEELREQIEEQTIQSSDEDVMRAKNYEAHRNRAEIFIEELINEPIITDIVDEDMVWYGDGYERMKENSECESRDGDNDNSVECFDNETAPASFVYLSLPF